MLFRSTLTKELFTTAISTILILSGVVLAQRAVYIFRLAARGIIPNDTIETVLVFNLLKHMPLLLSLTIFLTILVTLSRLYRDSEMIIWFSSGLSLKRFIPPILNFCFPIVILIGVLSLVISPWAIQKAEEYKSGLKSRDEISTLMPGSFKESKSDNRIFYIEGLDDFGKKVKNIFVQTSEKNKIGVIVSNEGERISKEDADYIVLKKGKRYESIKDSNKFSSTYFDEYGILIEKETPKLLSVGASAGMFEAIPTMDLIKIAIKDKNLRSKYLSEVMLRISQPISSLILIFIAIALSYVNPRVGRSLNIISALLIFIIYQNLMGVFQSLIGTGKVPIIFGFWPLHITFIIFALWLIRKRTNNKPLIPSFQKR
jgi:lipopolysaccharide export system permease protein